MVPKLYIIAVLVLLSVLFFINFLLEFRTNTSAKFKDERNMKFCLGETSSDILANRLLKKHKLLPLDIDVSACLLGEELNSTRNVSTRRFGVFGSSWNTVQKNMNANITVFHCERIQKIKDDCFSINCKGTKIFFIYLREKIDYYIGHDCSIDSKNNNLFAFKKFPLQVHDLANDASVFYPPDIAIFDQHLKSSKFIECDSSVAFKFKSKNADLYNTEPKLGVESFHWLAEIRDLLYELRMMPMLCCGTLLGWYRECGIIPYTHDFDVFIPHYQFNESFENVFLNHKDYRLLHRFGRINDSLEYTIRAPTGAKTDVFLLYDDYNVSWIGGIGNDRAKLRWEYPLNYTVCAADFLGHLFHVPCNTLEFIEFHHGPTWTEPLKSAYWYGDPATVHVRQYSEDEWKEIHHTF